MHLTQLSIAQKINYHFRAVPKPLSIMKNKDTSLSLKAILNSLPDTVIKVSYQGKILTIYGTATIALASKDNKGKHLDEVLPVFIAKGLVFNIKKAIETQQTQRFEYIDTSNKETQYFEARISPVNNKESVIILRNITSLKATEKALVDKVTAFEQEKRTLEKYIDTNMQMENFAYIASHDLREPLRTMRTFGQLLNRRIKTELDEKSRGYLDFILDASLRMNQLIEDLLTYTRANTEPFERAAINTTNVLSQVINDLNDEINKANAQIIVKDIPTTIYGSTVRVQQIFQNLIDNAIKFHRSEVQPIINISYQDTPTHWQFSIEDNGIGIAKEFFDDVFTVFKKLHGRQKYPGTGIGLALVKRIVGQHEGEIWVESDKKQGCTFYFTLKK